MRSVRMPSQMGLARLYKGLFAFSLAMLCTPVLAQDADGLEPLDLPWLQKVHKAARDLDYSGVIIYTQDQASQSMKLVHIIDGTGERERLEILDGEPREFLRQNEVTQCLIPEKKMVVIERRENERFPSFLVGDVSQLPNFYDMRRLPSRERVAGRPCDLIELVPKDDQRYGYRVCADTDHHLLLKMQTLDPQQAVVDQIAFASVAFGEQVDLQELRTSWNPSKWEVVEPEVQKIDLSEQGWHLA
ncbi:sigma-E factor regulatory protein RseB domain-containing protein, partial [Alcaligenes faecalis]|uniref:sigma-E factor regulatory protein RseB domain-containing protein n=1 Tax=Alcaligenes faecalis TaxID=511 RepID=UPI001E5EF718